jgi:hypothetical protein
MGESGGIIRNKLRPIPDFWQIHGHSWFQFQTGPSGDQTGRVDALTRAAFDIEYMGWRNRAFTGARAMANGRQMGGWTRAMQPRGIPGRAAPYANDGGATILCWAWNDAATYGLQNAATRQSLVDCHRSVISRCRASSVWETTNAARWAFTNWTLTQPGLDTSTNNTLRQVTVTTTNNATLTLPTDYDGGVVAVGFLLRPGATGVTLTITGTAATAAGFSGTTFYTGGGGQGTSEYGYTVKRFTTMTAANAGQTIIFTCTGLDASAPIGFLDSAWIESKTPPPVIVCNLHKSIINGANYGYYGAFNNTWSGTSTRTEAQMDADVDTYNGQLATMVATDFDGMVQIADVDQALNPGGVKGIANKTSDGIHPNEFGAGPIVDAIVAAKDRMTPPAGAWGTTLSFNGPAPRAGVVQRPHPLAYPYNGPDVMGRTDAAGVVPGAAGDLWAFPYVITGARETYSAFSIEVTTVGTVTSTWRFAVYDDVDQIGYPQILMPGSDPTTSAAFSPGIVSTGMRDSGSFNLGAGFVADPGFYWLVCKIDTLGTSQQIRTVAGQTLMVPSRIAAGTPVLATGYKLTGQGTGALPSAFPLAAVPTAGPAPALSFKRSK